MKPSTLLVELLTEELPPKALKRLGEAFADGIFNELKKRGFTNSETCQAFMTPRRLAVSIDAVLDAQPKQEVERKGPALASAYDAEGKPTKALEGFVRSCQSTLDALTTSEDGLYVMFKTTKEGVSLADCLADIVDAVAKNLPVPKLMHWGDTDYVFVRPVHSLVMMLGEEVVPGTVLGQASGKHTLGHRFLGEKNITLTSADRYDIELETRGSVIASFERRQQLIRDALELTASEISGASVLLEQSLLDEVTGLVEIPAVYPGKFEPEFLTVPQECLILSMTQHQKYFPLVDDNHKLLPQFLIVSNMPISDAKNIIAGNERVLRARLADAQFFYQQDIKASLENRLYSLQDVVYQNQLGTQFERAERLSFLASHIAKVLGLSDTDDQHAARAGLLCKADLVTDMVGEFPELQGIMGRYYALASGENEAVSTAIEQHYWPKFSGDQLPQTQLAVCCALADRLDMLVGIFGIGITPTGDKDPFALRRHTLALIRILMDLKLDFSVSALLKAATDNFEPGVLQAEHLAKIHPFIMDRLKYGCIDRGFDVSVVDSVLSLSPDRLDWILPKLQAVTEFLRMPEAESLAGANKRIVNILKKNAPEILPDINEGLFKEAQEKALYDIMMALTPQVHQAMSTQTFSQALATLAALKEPTDAFFDHVMVIDPDNAIRNNRLALLRQLASLMNGVADLSKLAVS